LWALNGTEGVKEQEDVTWYCETGAMGYEQPDSKYNGRFLIRARAAENTDARVLIQYDGAGAWEPMGDLQGTGLVKNYLLPVIPHRGDSIKLRIEGHGDFALYSIARERAAGSDRP
jgi:hypothetical protein